MRKEIAVGEIAYNLKGEAFEVCKPHTFGYTCNHCCFNNIVNDPRCRKFACDAHERQDKTSICFKRRPDLDRTEHPVGVFATPKGKRWEAVEWSGNCVDCDLYDKPGCDKCKCKYGEEDDPKVMLKRRKDLE